jgi:hypothetical protein
LELPDAQVINHIVVFLTTPLPQGYAATIHFGWPDKPWTLLGMVSNEKPSAVFKVGKKGVDLSENMMDSITASLGISIDTIDNVHAAVSTLPQSGEALSARQSEMSISTALVPASSSGSAMTIATRILDNLYNYCTSFATSDMPLDANVLLGRDISKTYIPLKVCDCFEMNKF